MISNTIFSRFYLGLLVIFLSCTSTNEENDYSGDKDSLNISSDVDLSKTDSMLNNSLTFQSEVDTYLHGVLDSLEIDYDSLLIELANDSL